ncbi:hypothetical protein HW555_009573 [Spodoptera exigua]|uniref:Uncharacterized protein n=1 Tax=Spodoptera exigua TaxID=7107 RepID=A0A835GAT7_SPOEX|nr:hypothetical protein HW555_009573 [Spodoptera exigua]
MRPVRRCEARRKVWHTESRSAARDFERTNANRARAAVRESTKRNYARECAKNPHDDADIQSRRNARRCVDTQYAA